MTSPSTRSQQGVALLMVLILIVVLALLAARMSEQFTFNYRKAGRSVALPQLRWMLIAAEQQGMARLQKHFQSKTEAGLVSLAQPWAQPFTLPVGEGNVSTTILSGQNCFNLNSALSFAAPSGNTTPAHAVLQLLLSDYGLNRQKSAKLITELASHLNVGSQKNAAVATQGVSQKSSGADTQQWLLDSKQFKLLPGFETLAAQPADRWLCVNLDKELAVSINTLTMQDAPLLAALSLSMLNKQDIGQLLAARPEQGWKNINDISAEINRLWPARKESLQVMLSMLSVNSQNFVIRSQAIIAGQALVMSSFVHYDTQAKKLAVWKRRYALID